YDFLNMWLIRTLQVAAFLVLSSQCESKLITSLPGLDSEVGFKQYSDYITVGDTNEKRLFYWYMESQSDPTTDPLVLWLNGGPGCSSFGGLFEELGPFYVRPNITLGRNEYSWNRIANLLFLESPAGVGFSKSTDPKDYRTNDNTTATDSLNFLLKFLQAFPHLKSHDFWMTGESYAGHYIPTLVQKIMEHNSQFPADQINLKGIMIGNPLTYLTINNGGVTDYVYSHNLIANETYQGIKKYCNYSFPSGGGEIFDQAKCNKYSEDSATEMGTINPYDIYVDVLIHIQGYIESKGKLGSPYYPCQDSYTSKYLNDPLVQKAIHADSTSWEDCNMEINIAYSKADVAQSMLPIYTNSILHHGLKVLVYSGDVDSVVPATATRRCINELNLPITSKWRYWTDSDGQVVGGYTEVYDGLTYATVRNAGHEVPSFQPMRAYDMFTRFIKTGSVIQK
uniref:Carboxypeptidase n=1 Tax=Ciona savignyi TaxID=51511 RepID=H2Y6L8_CIOSA